MRSVWVGAQDGTVRDPYAGPDRSAEASDPARRVACAVWGRQEAAGSDPVQARNGRGLPRERGTPPMAESGLIFGISDMIYCYDLRFPYSRYRVCEICDGRIVIYSRGASSELVDQLAAHDLAYGPPDRLLHPGPSGIVAHGHSSSGGGLSLLCRDRLDRDVRAIRKQLERRGILLQQHARGQGVADGQSHVSNEQGDYLIRQPRGAPNEQGACELIVGRCWRP